MALYDAPDTLQSDEMPPNNLPLLGCNAKIEAQQLPQTARAVAPARHYIPLDESARLRPSPGINFPFVQGREWRYIQPGEWLLVSLTQQRGLYLLQMLENQLSLSNSVPQAVFRLDTGQHVTRLPRTAIRRLKRCPWLAPDQPPCLPAG
jgi:hypothetical protein